MVINMNRSRNRLNSALPYCICMCVEHLQVGSPSSAAEDPLSELAATAKVRRL